MGKSGTLTVRVVSDTKGAEQGLDRFATKVSTTGDKLESAGKKMTIFATVPIAAAMGFAANAASDLNETLSKSNTVFGDSAKTVENWSNTASESFGQSKREALDAASSFGNLFVQLGVGSEQAAAMSMEMTELASDFASFHNADITEVIDAQTAAFRGEYDALQRFVPTINAATVEQKAMEQTGKALTSELTAQEKALAVQTLMLEGAGDAMGDFDRTSESAANQMRTAKASMEDAAAEIGSALLPMVASAAGGVADLAQRFGDLPGPVQNGVLAIAGFVAATGPVLSIGGKIANNVGQMADGFDTLRLKSMYLKDSLGGAAGLAAGLGAVGALVAVGATLYGDYSKTKAEASRITGLYVAAMQDENGVLSQNIDLTSAQELASRGYATAIREAGISFDVFTEAIRSQGDALESMDDDLAAFRDGMLSLDEVVERAGLSGSALGDSILELKGKMTTGEIVDLINDLDGLSDRHDEAAVSAQNQDAATDGLTESANAAKPPVDALTTSIDDETAAADRLKAATDAVKEATDRLIGVNISAEEAMLRSEAAYDAVSASLVENGTTLDANTEKGRANRQSILDAAGAALSHVEALKAQGASTGEVNWVLGAHVERLKETMRQAGMTEGEIAGYIQTLGLTPENIATVVRLNGVEAAERALNHVARSRIATIDGRVTVTGPGGFRAYHAGGEFRASRPGGEGLALLRDGERVSTPTEPDHGGSSMPDADAWGRQAARSYSAEMRRLSRAG